MAMNRNNLTIFQRIKNSTFFKAIVVLASGSILAQLIVVFAAPFITRLYTPEDIGVYIYILSLSQVFMAVINGRYDMSIVTEEKEEWVFPLIKVSFFICLFASIIISIGYGFYFACFSTKYSQYTYTAVFLFILLLSYGVVNILTSYNNRNKEYKLMSTVYVVRTSCQNIGAILLGLLSSGMLGLLVPYTIGQLLGINRQAKSLKPHLSEVKKVTGKEMVEVLKVHYKQPLFSTPALLANSFSYLSVTIFIEALSNMSVVGFYSISVRILGLPLSVISGNVSKVFFEEASREFGKTGRFNKSFIKTTIFLVALAIPMIVFMMILAPLLCSVAFGDDWEIAGQYIRILAPMFGIRFIVTALSPGLLVAKKQNYELALQLMFVVVSVLCFILAKAQSASIETYLMYVSITNTIVYAMFFIFIAIFSQNNKGIKQKE